MVLPKSDGNVDSVAVVVLAMGVKVDTEEGEAETSGGGRCCGCCPSESC